MVRHEDGREHPDTDVCLRCVGEVAEQRDAARVALAALRERAEDTGAELGLAVEAVEAERERAETAERLCGSMQEERDALWLAGSEHARRVALLMGLLRSVEWVNTADGEVLYCPRCGWSEAEGHAPGACALGAALAEGG